MNNIKQTETAAFDVLFVKIPTLAIETEVRDYYDDETTLILLEFGLENQDEESGFFGEVETDDIELPDGDWQILTDDLANVTEEQAAILVDRKKDYAWFFDYVNGRYKPISSVESLHSLAESVKAYIKNPMGEKPKRVGKWVEKEGIDTDYREFVYSKKFKEWRQAEANTGRWAVLYKPKNK